MSDDISQRILARYASTLDDEEFAAMFSPDGLAPTRDWITEDDWIVSYTTKRIRAGRLDGLFATFVYRPEGQGRRRQWRRIRTDRCDTRREAKQRALVAYYEHSPKAAARHGWTGEGYEDE